MAPEWWLVLLAAPAVAGAQGTRADYERPVALRHGRDGHQRGSVVHDAGGQRPHPDGETVRPAGAAGRRHTSGGTYGDRKRFDFLVRHLLGVEPPDWNALVLGEGRADLDGNPSDLPDGMPDPGFFEDPEAGAPAPSPGTGREDAAPTTPRR